MNDEKRKRIATTRSAPEVCEYRNDFDPATLEPVGPRCGEAATQFIFWRDGRISPARWQHGLAALDADAIPLVLSVEDESIYAATVREAENGIAKVILGPPAPAVKATEERISRALLAKAEALRNPAFAAGYRARLDAAEATPLSVELPLPANPHPPGSKEHAAFALGIEQADLECGSPDSWPDGGAGWDLGVLRGIPW